MLKLPGTGEYLLPGKRVATFQKKKVTRRIINGQARAKAIRGRKNAADLALPGGGWTQHDLRRTAATSMGGLGFTQRRD
jgi:hypothetical protein